MRNRKTTEIELALKLWSMEQPSDSMEPFSDSTEQSDEDIVKMLNSLDLTNVPKPNVKRFERMLRNETRRQKVLSSAKA